MPSFYNRRANEQELRVLLVSDVHCALTNVHRLAELLTSRGEVRARDCAGGGQRRGLLVNLARALCARLRCPLARMLIACVCASTWT
jgi:hypothetical protein